MIFKNRDVLLVSSPLQVLCAIEWKKNNSNSTLIIRHTSKDSEKIIYGLLEKYEEVAIHLKPFSNKIHKNLVTFSFVCFYILLSKGKLLLGDFQFSKFNQCISYVFKFKNQFLMDDGYATISFQKKLASKHSHLNLFTIFDLENMLLRRQTIIKNNLNILNKCKDPVIFDALFIGTDEVSKEWLGGKKEYINHIKEIIDKFKLSKLYYVPKIHGHAFKADDLEEINQIEEIEILETSGLIETYLDQENIFFNKAFSHLSTALFSLKTLEFIDKPFFITSKIIKKNKIIAEVHQSAIELIKDIEFVDIK